MQETSTKGQITSYKVLLLSLKGGKVTDARDVTRAVIRAVREGKEIRCKSYHGMVSTAEVSKAWLKYSMDRIKKGNR
ncbi:MAG: hypothetical protein IJF07_07635 [Lachnospiraceae bacterium]|nr:hypothetical protein [Lachnospiraceae bacterium]